MRRETPAATAARPISKQQQTQQSALQCAIHRRRTRIKRAILTGQVRQSGLAPGKSQARNTGSSGSSRSSGTEGNAGRGADERGSHGDCFQKGIYEIGLSGKKTHQRWKQLEEGESVKKDEGEKKKRPEEEQEREQRNVIAGRTSESRFRRLPTVRDS